MTLGLIAAPPRLIFGNNRTLVGRFTGRQLIFQRAVLMCGWIYLSTIYRILVRNGAFADIPGKVPAPALLLSC